MNQKLKFGLYATLILGALIFGGLFYSSYHRMERASNLPEETNSPAASVFKQTTNFVSSNSNQVETSNVVTDISETNATNAEVGVVASTNSVTTNASNEIPKPPAQIAVARAPTQGRSAMIGYLAAFLAMSILLGLLIARDVSEYFGSRSVEFMFNDEGTGIKNPEYDEAEQEWANGNHLEAIRMMRDYLNKNPREQYVALRIAEIYEKDLKNHLAAALEYEEILKHKLPAQRWGWAAIHLCNLYSKLKKTDEAVALLHRVVNEYGETPAAEKARKRLAMFENVGEEALDADLPESVQAAALPKVSAEPAPPASNLPPGFRPK